MIFLLFFLFLLFCISLILLICIILVIVIIVIIMMCSSLYHSVVAHADYSYSCYYYILLRSPHTTDDPSGMVVSACVPTLSPGKGGGSSACALPPAPLTNWRRQTLWLALRSLYYGEARHSFPMFLSLYSGDGRTVVLASHQDLRGAYDASGVVASKEIMIK